ncbi:GNAT family N-acetyltransferase [Granulicoccus phenolivorans]|uniref:GNAT family N-acetyltransferase n=1 Tax=Granulicoccus phenolivorans TaxID=266854 RepID=UPI0004796E84|nr:GNAT family protein [Granulicoccus phenolivorans]
MNRAGDHWPITLQHAGVVLRPIRVRDRGTWDAIREANRQWLSPWDATMPPGGAPGPRTYAGFVRMLTRQARQGQSLPWLVAVDRERGAAAGTLPVVGQLTVSGITYGSAQCAQVGYWIDQRWAGRGIIPTAVAMATDYCFAVLGLHRMEVAIRPENEKSLRVVRKLGFRHEGLRPRYLHIDGEWRDHEIFALHSEEVPGGLLARYEHGRPR